MSLQLSADVAIFLVLSSTRLKSAAKLLLFFDIRKREGDFVLFLSHGHRSGFAGVHELITALSISPSL